ncbi:hypothetical protein IGI42_000492 [Enterococcus sp. AZ109]
MQNQQLTWFVENEYYKKAYVSTEKNRIKNVVALEKFYKIREF